VPLGEPFEDLPVSILLSETEGFISCKYEQEFCVLCKLLARCPPPRRCLTLSFEAEERGGSWQVWARGQSSRRGGCRRRPPLQRGSATSSSRTHVSDVSQEFARPPEVDPENWLPPRRARSFSLPTPGRRTEGATRTEESEGTRRFPQMSSRAQAESGASADHALVARRCALLRVWLGFKLPSFDLRFAVRGSRYLGNSTAEKAR
jgi:hypothetical protein